MGYFRHTRRRLASTMSCADPMVRCAPMGSVGPRVERPWTAGPGPTLGASPALAARKRRHVQCTWCARRPRPALGTRPHSPAVGQERVGIVGGRDGSARHASEPDPGRSLRPARIASHRVASAQAGIRPQRLFAPLPRHPRAARHIRPPLCRSPGSRSRRPLDCAGRPHARSVGRRLRSGKPDCHLAHPAD